MKHNPFKNLKKGEWLLLVVSVAVIALSSFVKCAAVSRKLDKRRCIVLYC